jgi:small subunit ribosomal protein S1
MFEEAVKKYSVGDKIKVVVVEVSPEKQKVAFSIKDYKKKVQREEISRYMSSEEEKDNGSYTLGDFLKNKSN